MVDYVHTQCISEWGAWKEWLVNPHNDGLSHINMHAPRLTLGSPGSSFLYTWSSFFSPKELRIKGFISQALVC
jgi:hypothetical protein